MPAGGRRSGVGRATGARRPARIFPSALAAANFPLARALCFDMIAVGSAVNLATFAAAMLLFSGDVPDVYGVALLLAHIPYNLLVFTGVWRSADAAPPSQAWSARLVAVVWLVVFFVL